MPHIYLWNPNYMDQEVGHVSLKLSDGTYISHWPADQKKAFGTVRGDKYTFYDDVEVEGRQPDETLELPSGMLDEDDIRRWWDRFKGDYNVLVNNCAQVIHKALIVGGAEAADPSLMLLAMPISRGLTGLPGNGSSAIVTPRDLMNFAKNCKARFQGGVRNLVASAFGLGRLF